MSEAKKAKTGNDAPLVMPKRHDTYSLWLEEQRIPIFRGYYIEDINDLPLEPWDLKGVPASFVILEGTGGVNDAYVCEIPPGGKTHPQKHMYEEMAYVTKGHGSTTVWQRDGRKHSFEWGPGSLFAIPMNANYVHYNTSGREGARFYAVTNCCFMMNLFHSTDYIFNNDYVFRDRFDPDSVDDYFSAEGKIENRLFMTTNFVPDVRTVKLYDYSVRGKDSTNLKFNLAGQSMGAHVSEFPVGSYKKGHRHGPGAHLIVLNGKGYSILWEPGKDKPIRVNWKPGTVVVPPDQWLHQHFNSGAERVRYLAMHRNNWFYKPLVKGSTLEASFTSVKQGGNQIEFEDEDPSIHRDFVDELHRNGAECVMCDYFAPCPKKAKAMA
jgi:quercetin dioxygenase-like cupin family protein